MTLNCCESSAFPATLFSLTPDTSFSSLEDRADMENAEAPGRGSSWGAAEALNPVATSVSGAKDSAATFAERESCMDILFHLMPLAFCECGMSRSSLHGP
ncbi:hypothetical protein ABZ424_34040 [Streptomyces sp. NPDC005790]|uniref:hypothetical protein n=1 Tax=Streptomyces sp. NPDC005790 TaxID=3154777 RepID=UPI0033E1AF95